MQDLHQIQNSWRPAPFWALNDLLEINRLNGITADGQLSIFTDISLLGDNNGN